MVLPPEKTVRRGEFTNRKWYRLKPLLPPQKTAVGSPSKNYRTAIDGILWIARTGAPWRDLPSRYGARQTVAGRFYRWRKTGLWQRLLETLQQEADAQGKIDISGHKVWEYAFKQQEADKARKKRMSQLLNHC
jgi:transposase